MNRRVIRCRHKTRYIARVLFYYRAMLRRAQSAVLLLQVVRPTVRPSVHDVEIS